MTHVLVVYTDDEPGVLTRVASLFRRRGFNIHSLTVGPTERPSVSRMTVVVDTDANTARRAVEHLRKLEHAPSVAMQQVPPEHMLPEVDEDEWPDVRYGKFGRDKVVQRDDEWYDGD